MDITITLRKKEKSRDLLKSHDSFESGGEDRTRTCKPVRAVVFKTTALPIMLLLHNWQFENISQSKLINNYKPDSCDSNKLPMIESNFSDFLNPAVFRTTSPV